MEPAGSEGPTDTSRPQGPQDLCNQPWIVKLTFSYTMARLKGKCSNKEFGTHLRKSSELMRNSTGMHLSSTSHCLGCLLGPLEVIEAYASKDSRGERFCSTRASFPSGQCAESLITVVGGIRGKSGWSKTCKFYLCTIGSLLHNHHHTSNRHYQGLKAFSSQAKTLRVQRKGQWDVSPEESSRGQIDMHGGHHSAPRPEVSHLYR